MHTFLLTLEIATLQSRKSAANPILPRRMVTTWLSHDATPRHRSCFWHATSEDRCLAMKKKPAPKKPTTPQKKIAVVGGESLGPTPPARWSFLCSERIRQNTEQRVAPSTQLLTLRLTCFVALGASPMVSDARASPAFMRTTSIIGQ
jgi:hypothetical protein